MSSGEIKVNEEASAQAANELQKHGDDLQASLKYIDTMLKALDSWKGRSGTNARQMCRRARVMVGVLAAEFASIGGQVSSAQRGLASVDADLSKQYKAMG